MRFLIAAFLCLAATTVWAGEYAVEVYVVEKMPTSETKAVPFFNVANEGDKEVGELIREATFSAVIPRVKDGEIIKVIKNQKFFTLNINQSETPAEIGESISVNFLKDSNNNPECFVDYQNIKPKTGREVDNLSPVKIRTSKPSADFGTYYGKIRDTEIKVRFLQTKVTAFGSWVITGTSFNNGNEEKTEGLIMACKVTKL